MNKTKIEWVKNPDGSQGYTWNPITGCLNGCPYCYAKKLTNGRLILKYLANHNVAVTDTTSEEFAFAMTNPFYPRFWPERLDKARLELMNAEPRGIFPVDMGELFGDWVPVEWQEEIFDLIREFPQHRFYLLTKQPQNLIKFSPFPDNCWVGVTATSNTLFHQAIRYLLQVEAKVKYISVEPFLEPIYTGGMIGYKRTEKITALTYRFIDWLIIGAQTKPYKPPKVEWVEEIVRACDKAGVPVFLKDNLRPLLREHITIDDKWALAKNIGYGGLYKQEMPSLTKE